MRKKENEKKKEKEIGVKPIIITIHASPMKVKDVEMNQIMGQNDDCHHRNHPHASSKNGGATDVCEAHVQLFLYFLNLHKTKNAPKTKQ